MLCNLAWSGAGGPLALGIRPSFNLVGIWKVGKFDYLNSDGCSPLKLGRDKPSRQSIELARLTQRPFQHMRARIPRLARRVHILELVELVHQRMSAISGTFVKMQVRRAALSESGAL